MKTLAVVCLLCLLAAIAGATDASQYVVTMPTPTATAVAIEAQFTLQGDVIAMLVHGSPQLANGQADLVDSIIVTGADGREISATDLGMGDWKLEDAVAGERVTVNYQVRLAHDQYDWNAGIDEMAYRTDDGLFFTGSSLFIIPGTNNDTAATVVFDLPEDWRATAPWDRSGKLYEIPDLNTLIRNCFFVGTHREETLVLDGFTFTLVLTENLWQKRGLVIATMEPVLPAARRMFGGMPLKNRYLAVISQSDRSDGGAFSDSYSMLIKGEADETSAVVWGHGITHELVHFWNGHSMAPTSQLEEWFKEGFTDYITLLIRSREGLDSREIIFRKLENSQRRFLLSRMMMGIEESMREAGKNKHRNRMLVYGGGTLVGFALDVTIREATANERGLDEFIAAFFAEFGDGKTRYDLADIVRVASAVAGIDLSGFFTEHTEGSGSLDVNPYARKAGLRVDTMMDEFYISERADATAAERAIGESILGAPRRR